MKLELDPRNSWHETIVFTNYDNAQGHGYGYNYSDVKERFYITLPESVADALGFKEVRAVDQAKVRALFLETIEKFKHLQTEINRVILYEIDVSPKDGKPTFHSPTGFAIEVWAATYEETVAISGNGAKRYSYRPMESSLGYPGEYGVSSRTDRGATRFHSQVPWTDKNEAFFKWVGDNMLELINRLSEINDPVKLLDAIDAGRLLPLGNSNKGKTE
jgi:hypothetical protein